MEEQFIEHGIKCSLKQIITDKVNKEIEEEVDKFRKKLEDRKDDYIAEIMKGIRLYHERDEYSMGVNYKIVFENVYRKGE